MKIEDVRKIWQDHKALGPQNLFIAIWSLLANTHNLIWTGADFEPPEHHNLEDWASLPEPRALDRAQIEELAESRNVLKSSVLESEVILLDLSAAKDDGVVTYKYDILPHMQSRVTADMGAGGVTIPLVQAVWELMRNQGLLVGGFDAEGSRSRAMRSWKREGREDTDRDGFVADDSLRPELVEIAKRRYFQPATVAAVERILLETAAKNNGFLGRNGAYAAVADAKLPADPTQPLIHDVLVLLRNADPPLLQSPPSGGSHTTVDYSQFPFPIWTEDNFFTGPDRTFQSELALSFVDNIFERVVAAPNAEMGKLRRTFDAEKLQLLELRIAGTRTIRLHELDNADLSIRKPARAALLEVIKSFIDLCRDLGNSQILFVLTAKGRKVAARLVQLNKRIGRLREPENDRRAALGITCAKAVVAECERLLAEGRVNPPLRPMYAATPGGFTPIQIYPSGFQVDGFFQARMRISKTMRHGEDGSQYRIHILDEIEDLIRYIYGFCSGRLELAWAENKEYHSWDEDAPRFRPFKRSSFVDGVDRYAFVIAQELKQFIVADGDRAAWRSDATMDSIGAAILPVCSALPQFFASLQKKEDVVMSEPGDEIKQEARHVKLEDDGADDIIEILDDDEEEDDDLIEL
ncbi:hypothetical protein DFJ74DRAFT_713628 [Hyaloraphidium curvatum]|nr:hypothetical protein DFJ74DRAFT_713628 [Hyaloraphidium curvatum]